MKRGLKIKAGFIFLSWLVILAHDIIPHYHISTDSVAHAGYVRIPYDNTVESSDDTELRAMCEGSGACSASNHLFKNFTTDKYFIHTESWLYTTFLDQCCPFLFKDYKQFQAVSFPGSVLLRAPPVA